MKQRTVLLLALIAGLLAFGLTVRYLRAERDRLFAGAEKIDVLAARRDLPAGTTLKVEDLGRKAVFKMAVGENAVRVQELDLVVGKKLKYSVRSKDPLLWSLVDAPFRTRAGLSRMIKNGLRAVSIAVGGEAAVSGLVQPDDHVDILGTFNLPSRSQPGETETVTLTILQDVTVLATGQQIAHDDYSSDSDRLARRAGGYGTVTLEVTLREAELLAFTQTMKGRLSLALRHPEDVGYEKDLPEINFQQLEKSLPGLNQHRQRVIRHKTDL